MHVQAFWYKIANLTREGSMCRISLCKQSHLFHLESFCMETCLENCAYALALPSTKHPV